MNGKVYLETKQECNRLNNRGITMTFSINISRELQI